MNTLGKTARIIRERAGLSRPQLAKKTGLDEEWIRRLEDGNLKQIDHGLQSLRTLAAALGYPLAAFLRQAKIINVEDVEDTELAADPGLRQLVADLNSLDPAERLAVEELIRAMAQHKSQAKEI